MGLGLKLLVAFIIVVVLCKAPDLVVSVINGLFHGLSTIGTGVNM